MRYFYSQLQKTFLTFRTTSKLLIPLFALIIQFNNLIAQSKIVFTQLETKDGLSQNYIQCILKDSKGFMWFGTLDGLNRYDGYSFKAFYDNPNDSNSLPSNNILSLYEDSGNNLWIGTAFGIAKMNLKTYYTNRYKFNNESSRKPSGNEVKAIVGDKENNIWAATANSIYLINNSNSIQLYFTLPFEVNSKDNSIADLYIDTKGRVWVLVNNGMLYFKEKSATTFRFFSKIPKGNRDVVIHEKFFETKEKMIWIPGINGGLQIDPNTLLITPIYKLKKELEVLKTMNILSYIQYNERYIWILVGGQKIYVYDIIDYHFVDQVSQLLLTGYESFFSDRNGYVWIGTNGNGLFKWSEHNAKLGLLSGYNFQIKNTSIRGIYSDKDSIIWIGGYKGLDKYDLKRNRNVHYRICLNSEPENINYVRTITQDLNDENILWLGIEWPLIVRFDKRDGKTTKYFFDKKSDLIISYVFSAAFDKNGILWLGTNNGLVKFNTINKSFEKFYSFSKAKSTSQEEIRQIYIDKDGKLYLAATSIGMVMFDPVTESYSIFNKDNNKFKFTGKEVTTLHKDFILNQLWLGTNSGLFFIDNNKKVAKSFTTANGLPNNVIYGILQSNDGNIWVSTNSGISCYIKSKGIFLNYTPNDGLQDKEFNSGAFHRNNYGDIFFGGIKGVNFFNPEKLILSNPTSSPVITDIKLFNSTLSPLEKYDGRQILNFTATFTESIKLNYNENTISIEFSAVNYLESYQNEYIYTLENFDTGWLNNGKNHSVTYSQLPYGEYTFKVKLVSRSANAVTPECTLKIIIVPPWWQTLVFKIIAIAFLLLSVFYAYKYRIKKIQRQNILLEQRIKERTAQLNNAYKNLEESNSKLESSNNKLETANTDLAKAISELEYSNDQLQILNNKLEFSNKELEAFSYSVSHDLKAPLRSIKSFTQIMKEDFSSLLPNEGVQFLDRIIASSGRMDNLIEELLKLAKLSRFELTFSEVNLSSISEDILRVFVIQNKARRIEYTVENNLFAKCDSTLITTLLENLLSNALKYSSKTDVAVIEFGSTSNFDRSKCNSEKVFFVKDNGVGFDMTNYDKLFKILTRLHTNYEFDGTGIGLANAAKIVHKHGGTIWAESEINKGATFFFSLGN